MEEIERGRRAPAHTHACATTVDVAADVDLTGVDPTRWAETRRRIAILREWCAKPRHPKAECEAAATQMGVSVGQFVRLVAAWKAHGEAVRVSGANRRRGAALGKRSLPQATRHAIDAAIAALGPAAGFVSIRDEAARRCHEGRTPTASDGMVHYLLMRARRDVGRGRSRDMEGRLLVGHVNLLLPIADDDGGSFIPTLLLAVEEDSRAVVGHRLLTSPPPWDGAVASLVTEILQSRLNDADGPVAVAGDLNPPKGDQVVRVGGPRLLAPVLGSHLDTLPLRHQRKRAGESRRAPGAAVSWSDAEIAVKTAIAAHNGRLVAR